MGTLSFSAAAVGRPASFGEDGVLLFSHSELGSILLAASGGLGVMVGTMAEETGDATLSKVGEVGTLTFAGSLHLGVVVVVVVVVVMMVVLWGDKTVLLVFLRPR